MEKVHEGKGCKRKVNKQNENGTRGKDREKDEKGKYTNRTEIRKM